MQPTTNWLILLIPACLTVLLLAIGAALLIYALMNRRKAAESVRWAQAGGRVLSAVIQEHVTHGEHGIHHYFEPVIEYEYNVVGTPYRGSRLAFGSSSGGRKRAEETMARYAPGAPVIVYYDPQNPAEAVLERQARGGTIPIIVGIMFLGVGLVFGCVGGVIVFFLASSQ